MRDLLGKIFVSLSILAVLGLYLCSGVTYAQDTQTSLGLESGSKAGAKKKKIDSPLLADAMTITYGDSVLGTLTDTDPRSRLFPDPGWVATSGRPADTYTISSSPGDTIWLQVDKLGESNPDVTYRRPVLYLFKNNVQVGKIDEYTSGGSNIFVLEDGVYEIEVVSSREWNGDWDANTYHPYILRIARIGGPPKPAQSISIPAKVYGALTTHDGRSRGERSNWVSSETAFTDNYSFTGSKGDTIVIQVHNTSKTYVPVTGLYKNRNAVTAPRIDTETRNAIIANLPALIYPQTYPLYNYNMIYIYVIPEDGTYELEVCTDGGVWSKTGPYEMLITNGTTLGYTYVSYGADFSDTLTSKDLTFRGDRYSDLYYFTGSEGDSVLVELIGRNFDTYLFLFGPDNTAEDHSEENGLTRRSWIGHRLKKSGLYTVEVTSYNKLVSGSYSLSIRLVSNAAQYSDASKPLGGISGAFESNNTASKAYGPLRSGKVYEAYLEDSTDVDWYSFQFASGSALAGAGPLDPRLVPEPIVSNFKMRMHQVTKSKAFNNRTFLEAVQMGAILYNLPADYDLIMYASTGSQPVGWSEKNDTDDELISFPDLSADTYYLAVWSKVKAFSSSESYKLKVNWAEKPESGAYEPNDSLKAASGPLVSNQLYEGYIDAPRDYDWYYFEVSGGALLAGGPVDKKDVPDFILNTAREQSGDEKKIKLEDEESPFLAATSCSIILTNLPFDYDMQLFSADSVRSFARSENPGLKDERIELSDMGNGKYYIWIFSYTYDYSSIDSYLLSVGISGAGTGDTIPQEPLDSGWVELPLAGWYLSGDAQRTVDKITLGTYAATTDSFVLRQLSEIILRGTPNLDSIEVGLNVYYDDGMNELVKARTGLKNTRADMSFKPLQWRDRRVKDLSFSQGNSGVTLEVQRVIAKDEGATALFDTTDLGGAALNHQGKLSDSLHLLIIPPHEATENQVTMTGLTTRLFHFIGNIQLSDLPKSSLDLRVRLKSGRDTLIAVEMGPNVKADTVDLGAKPSTIELVRFENSVTAVNFIFRQIKALQDTTTYPPAVTLSCGSAFSTPDTVVEVPVSLDNSAGQVKSLSFVITPDSSKYLTFKSVAAASRTAGWTVEGTQSGSGMLITLTPGATTLLPAGKGEIAKVSYQVSGSAPKGTSISLSLSQAQVLDPWLRAAELTLQNGNITIGASAQQGDVNQDNKTDIFDLLDILRVFSGAKEQHLGYDVTGDGNVNIFDLLELLKKLAAR